MPVGVMLKIRAPRGSGNGSRPILTVPQDRSNILGQLAGDRPSPTNAEPNP